MRFGAFLLIGGAFLLGYRFRPAPVETARPSNSLPPSATHPLAPTPMPAVAGLSPESKRGAELARAVCITCHLFPEPALLDRITWGLEVLPRMAYWLGGTPFDYDHHPGGALVREAGVIPQAPLISVRDWRAICAYYLESAPSELVRSPAGPQIHSGLKLFRPTVAPYQRNPPMTSLVKIDPQRRKVYVGDSGTGTLDQLNVLGQPERSMKIGGAPVRLTFGDDGWYLTLLGDFFGSDELKAGVIRMEPPKAGGTKYQTLLRQCPRTTDTELADLDGDGRTDLVVCHFGNILGRFSWYQNLDGTQYKEHVLLNRTGAIRSYVRDFNGDGRPDIIVLMAQAWEGIWLFLNRGNGNFEETILLQQPSLWGYTDFELADFNHDGFIDIIAANGDSGDNIKIPPSAKPFHGIRIYLNDGKNHFREAFFHPLYGVFKVLARDYDNDGDLDVAAISFYADYDRAPEESLLYLENTGERQPGSLLRFKTYSIPEGLKGRWVTADAGDLDGDGDIDLVLGSFQQGFSPVSPRIEELWNTERVTLLILSNTLRN